MCLPLENRKSPYKEQQLQLANKFHTMLTKVSLVATIGNPNEIGRGSRSKWIDLVIYIKRIDW